MEEGSPYVQVTAPVQELGDDYVRHEPGDRDDQHHRGIDSDRREITLVRLPEDHTAHPGGEDAVDERGEGRTLPTGLGGSCAFSSTISPILVRSGIKIYDLEVRAG